MLTPELAGEVDRLVALHTKEPLRTEEVVSRLRDLVIPENHSDVLNRLPPTLVKPLRSKLRRAYPTLQAVGYWVIPTEVRRPNEEGFPDPKLLIRADWHAQEKCKVVTYLRAGWNYQTWRGFSYCRFDCGVDDRDMGYRDLTDGEWFWPEGLAHYVECHDIRLPDEFIAFMRQNQWQIALDEWSASQASRNQPDYSFWVAWAALTTRSATGPPGPKTGKSHER